MPRVSLMKTADATYIGEVSAELARRISVEVGDAKQADFYPQFKSLHWDNECNFSVRLVDDNPTGGIVRSVGNTVEWERAGRTARFYDVDGYEDGGFRFEVGLASRPASNILLFTIQSKGFDFFFQPPLTAEEIAAGHERPPEVEGSYAVYHSSKRNNFAGGKEYRTGKAFHIYRPIARDSAGKQAWCDLHIDTSAGLLTITTPWEFLDSASYPVMI